MKKIITLFSSLFLLNLNAQVSPTCFSNPVINYPVAPFASRGVAAGDLNNDNIPDVVTANMNSSNISVAYMNAGGFMGSGTNIPLGSLTPRAATIADFNNDLYNDIAVAGTNGIGFAMSNGTGGFITNTLNVGNPYGIANGDFNGDNNLDIVTANNTSGDVAVRLGNGDGTFSVNTNYMTDPGCYFVAVGYMNSDDTLDIVTCNIGSETVSVLIGVGDGTFNPAMSFGMGGTVTDPYSLTIGDVNNDGNNDVMLAAFGSGSMVVMMGSTTGNLFMLNTSFVGGQPFGITSGYYNEDNFLDVAVSGYTNHNVTVFTGNGDGTFNTDAVYTTTNSLGLAATADFNGDGFSDIVTSNYGNSGSGQGGFYLLLNHRSKITAITPTEFCPGGMSTLSANYGNGFVYNWTPSGDTNDTTYVSTSDTVTLTLSNTNATCSTSVSQIIVQHPNPTVTATANPNPVCQGGQTTFAGSGAQTYSWSGGVTDGVPFTPASAGTYTVVGIDTNGCIGANYVTLAFSTAPMQQLCAITADSATSNFFVLAWEKPADMSMIDSFYIYREITLNNYSKIGAVHKDSLSEYSDYGANPNSTTYRYKVATHDTCGNISTLGNYHSSIHLQYFGNGNFQWSHYLIEGTGQVAAAYNFYRDDTGSGPLNLLQVVSGSSNSFTDVNYLSYPNARYRVDVDWTITCTPTRGAINTSRSNIKSPTSIGLADINHDNKLSVSPNPFNNSFVVESTKGFDKDVLKLYNNLGQLVLEQQLFGNKIYVATENMASGVYTYTLTGANSLFNGKIIKN